MAFPLFSELPLEIQDQIWQSCLNDLSPTAHFTQLQHTQNIDKSKPTHGPGQFPKTFTVQLIRSKPPHTWTSPTSDILSTFHSLRTINRQSRTVALSYRETKEPFEPLLLCENPIESNSLPALHIDAATDLIILQPGWNIAAVETLNGATASIHLQEPDQLRYMAVPWKLSDLMEDRTGSLYAGICGLTAAYYTLRILFVIIEPEDMVLRDSAYPDGWGGNEIAVLERCLAAYRRGKLRPTFFQCGSRQYFEIPVEQVPKLDGLRKIIDVLEKIRNNRGQAEDIEGFKAEEHADSERDVESEKEGVEFWEPLRFRLMSWRPA